MEKQILTNEVKLNFTIESIARINRRFVIIRFGDEGEFIKKYDDSPLDILKYQLDALSVAYLRGKQFYALFDRQKHGSEFDIQNRINAQLENYSWRQGIAIKSVQARKGGTVDNINEQHLAQLLFNALPNLAHQDYMNEAELCNSTGKLFFIVNTIMTKKKDEYPEPIISQYETIELSLQSGRFPLFNLGVNVKTFTSSRMWQHTSGRDKNWTDLKFFKIDGLTRTMRRISVVEIEKDEKNVFIDRQFKNTRASIALLDFKNYSAFEKSKCGVLHLFQRLVEQYLKDYVTLEFIKPNFDNVQNLPFNDEQWSEVALKDFYGVRDLVLVDEVKNEKSIILLDRMKNTLEEMTKSPKNADKKPELLSILRGCQIIEANELSSENPNLRMIHEKKHYENPLDDPHQSVPVGCLVHHLTVESFDPSKEALENVLKELVIKNDILNGKITLTDWGFEDGWQFVLPDNDGGLGHLTIKKGGRFDFGYYHRNDLTDDEWCLDILTAIAKRKPIFEAWVISPDGSDINGIFHTNRLVLPSFRHIGDELRAESNNTELSQQEIGLFFGEFFKAQPSFLKEEKVVTICEKLKKQSRGTSKKELQELIVGKAKGETGNKTSNNFKAAFTAFYKEKLDDVFATFFRGKEQREALFPLNINYDFKAETPFYYVGKADGKEKSLQKTLINASNIREIHVVKGNLVFEPLLDTLNVDFVKHGELTVLPFPFKYLRELMQQTVAENAIDLIEN